MGTNAHETAEAKTAAVESKPADIVESASRILAADAYADRGSTANQKLPDRNLLRQDVDLFQQAYSHIGAKAGQSLVAEIDRALKDQPEDRELIDMRVQTGLSLLDLYTRNKDASGVSISHSDAEAELTRLAKLPGGIVSFPFVHKYATVINAENLADLMVDAVTSARFADKSHSRADQVSMELSCGVLPSYSQESLDQAGEIIRNKLDAKIERDENMSVKSIDLGDGVHVRRAAERQNAACQRAWWQTHTADLSDGSVHFIFDNKVMPLPF
jgi:hypothetical protein